MFSIDGDSESKSPPLQSCEECRRRKRKWCKSKPKCSTCVKYVTECVYRNPRKRGPPKGYMSGLRSADFLTKQESSPKKRKQSLNIFSEQSMIQPRVPINSLRLLSRSLITLPKIPLQLQIELIRTFWDSFTFSAPIFHHDYFLYRLREQVLPDFLLQTMFAIGSRFFLKNHELGNVDKYIPSEWLDIVRNADFTGTSLLLAQQQVFMQPDIYNAIALTFLSMMLYYDGENSMASTCLVMAAKIVQESNLALEDVSYDTIPINPTCIIEKEERRRLFWCLLLTERWAQKISVYGTRVMDEKRTYVLPPGSELKWQQMPFLIPETQSCIYGPSFAVISYEDRQMWSFMIELELLHSDISCLADSLINYSKFMIPFKSHRYTYQPSNSLARLHQLEKALQNWDQRLPAKHRYTSLLEAVDQCAIIQLDTVKIPRWMRIVYLISKLHLYEIRMTCWLKTLDANAFKDCLETVAEFVEIIRLLPKDSLTDDTIILFNAPFACRVLLTIVNCLIDEGVCGFSDAERLLLSQQAKQQTNLIYELSQKIDPIWRHVIQDISRLTQMKEAINQAFSLLEASITEAQAVVLPPVLREATLTLVPDDGIALPISSIGQVYEGSSESTMLENFVFPFCH